MKTNLFFILSIKLLLGIFILQSINCSGQQAIIISNKVDYLVDSEENFRYLLFLDYPFEELKGIQFFSFNNTKFKMVVYLKDSSTIEKELSDLEIAQFKNKIKNQLNEYQSLDTLALYSITLKNGKYIQGRIKSFTNKTIELNSEIFERELLITNDVLKVIRTNNNIHQNIENPDFARYFFSSSAIPIDKGQGYIQDIHIFSLSAYYSFTNHLVMGVSYTYVPETDMQGLFLLSGRANYKLSEKINLNFGGIFYNEGAMSKIGLFAISNLTYGTKNSNATFGILYGYKDNGFINYPVFNLNGMTRVSKNFSLISENWFGNIATEDYRFYNIVNLEKGFFCMTSFGFRFFTQKISFDVALYDIYKRNHYFIPDFPYFDIVYRF